MTGIQYPFLVFYLILGVVLAIGLLTERFKRHAKSLAALGALVLIAASLIEFVSQ